ARGVAVGLGPALGVAALVASIGGWLLERELPAGAGWLNPFEFIGATEMVFDTIFVLRDRAPEWFDLAVAAGTMAAFAALATFLTGALTRRLGQGLAPLLFCLVLVASLGTAGPAHALDFRHEKGDIRVADGETVSETLVASGERVTIDGTIDGDLVVLAERFVLSGKVTGNLFAAARELDLEGEVEGSAHVAGERVSVEGSVGGSLYAGAETVTLREAGSADRDMLLAGEEVRMEGRAGRNFTAFGDTVEIRGSVARDAKTYSERLVVHPRARIGGDLDLKLPEDGEAEIPDEAAVGGEIRRGVMEHEEEGSRFADPRFYLECLVFLVSAFLLGMALQQGFPRLFTAHMATAPEFFRALGYGFLGLVATPLLIALCFVTVVGIPIGVIGVFVYLTALFVSLIVVAALIGSALLDREAESPYAFGASLLLGLAIVLVAANLPFLGGLVKILVLLTGLGLLLSTASEAWQERGTPA
ncbi:MAG: polymer-forming cytoskeletal protein, partial [Myxococcales bacterium]|nr:polymer-forming cytoskeletal protein [Myxococcales bacterium]